MLNDDRVKILFIIEATTGGAYSHVLYLLKNLSKNNFDITVVLSPVRNHDQCAKDVEALKNAGINCELIPMQRKISIVEDLKSFWALYIYMKGRQFDILHTHSSKAGIIGRICAVIYKINGIIYTPHCFHFQGKTGIKKLFFKKIEQYFAKYTDCIISVSKSEEQIVLSEKIIRSECNTTIFNAIDCNKQPELIDKNKIRNKFGINKDHKIIAGIGRLAAQKDWQTFILIAKEVLKKDQQVSFIIAGSGEDEKRIIKLIKKYCISSNVIMIGHYDNIDEIYGIADILLNTSLWEGLSYTILEAMYASVPIVATNIAGNTNVILHKENGFLFNPYDYQAGAAQILNLLYNKELCQKISDKAHKYVVAHHDIPAFILHHEQLYFSLSHRHK